MAFTHLHVHTEYSLLDGLGKVGELVSRAAELGMDSLAITDHGVMYGVIDFYRKAKAAGIKPIIGCEIYVAPGSRFSKEAAKGDDKYYHLVLLAENDTGYHNLMKIVSAGFTEGYYYKPRVDHEVLEMYHEGIIALSACLAGEVARNLTRRMYDEAVKAAKRYQDIFGEGNFYLELQDAGLPEQQEVNMSLMRMHQETGIPLVATNDVHYILAGDQNAHDVLLCIQTGKKLQDEDRMRYESDQYYLKSEEEMRALFPYAAEALDNTAEIAARCNVEIEFGVPKLPRYPLPEGKEDAFAYLRELCEAGLTERYPDTAEENRARMEYELSVIKSMGYVDYFLIVWDFIHYARSQGIAVGPGRGSAAGSIVSYCLHITNIDPIRYALLFERFLNPERVSMPDIDVDFCFERRQEVIDYVVRKYGKDHVVQIVTFGTMAARGVIRDVGRVMDLPYALCDKIAKMVPMELGITIQKALKDSPDLAEAYRSDEEVHQLIDMSLRLEGLPRHASMHAAGVVISQKPVGEYVPLSRAADGSITTQFTMTVLEELGLLKMDFLGLRTLTVIQDAVNLINRDGGHFSIDELTWDDEKVFDSIGTGHNDGVFQLESSGMKSFMKELRPKNLEDVIAGISLYRPGPMEFIPKYIKWKTDPSLITYHTPQLAPILEATYGCIVYQEQVMQIVRDLGGYTLGRSDLVRRAMSKKKADVMAKERQNFIYGSEEEGVPGCLARGISEEAASVIFDEMTDFAKYAFNKSHAAAYAVVAYQTAYLKYYYPKEFMAALMTSVMDNTVKVSEYILTCRQMGIPVSAPDINRGVSGFSVADGAVTYGLSAIKSIGRGVIRDIVEEREAHGPYQSLNDFVGRLAGKDLNKRAVENLIKAGALDVLPGNRRQKMVVFPQLMDEKNRSAKSALSGQMSLFDLMEDEERIEYETVMPDLPEYPKSEMLAYEKEVLGIYLSGHPLEDERAKWEKNVTAATTDFLVDDEEGSAKVKDGERAVIGGMISAVTVKTTKNGGQMAFLTLEDLYGTVEVLIFPRDYQKYRAQIAQDARVFIRGRVSVGDEEAGKLILESMIPFSEAPGELWLRFADRGEWLEKQDEIMDLLAESDGKDGVGIMLAKEKQYKRLPASKTVSADPELIAKLSEKLGAENVCRTEKQVEFDTWIK